MRRLIRGIASTAVLLGVWVVAAGAAGPAFFVTENEIRYDSTGWPAGERSPGQSDQTLSATRILSRSRERQWAAGLHGGGFRVDQTLTLPERDWAVTENLGELNGFVSYTRFKGGPRSFWGTTLRTGSASDHLFNSMAETEVEFTGLYSTPSGERNAWMLLFQYSNNRSFLNHVPLPGFAYSWKSMNQQWRIMAGFPLAFITFTPTENWTIEGRVIGPNHVGLDIERRLIRRLKAYAGYERQPKLWLRANRDDLRNRLIYDAKMIRGGLRFAAGTRVDVDLGGGWAFDRRWIEAHSPSDLDRPYESLDNQPFARLTINWRY